MSRDYGGLTLHDLPEHEAESIRADAFDTSHPQCERCGDRLCNDRGCCCCLPGAVVDETDPGLLFCSRECRGDLLPASD